MVPGRAHTCFSVFPNIPPGTQKGPHFQSPVIDTCKNHTKPKQRQWMQLSITFSITENKYIKECPGKWENDTNYMVTENGSINPFFQNDVQRCLKPKGHKKLLIQIVSPQEKALHGKRLRTWHRELREAGQMMGPSSYASRAHYDLRVWL